MLGPGVRMTYAGGTAFGAERKALLSSSPRGKARDAKHWPAETWTNPALA